MKFGNETVTVLRPVGTDRHGDPLPGDPAETDSPGWDIQPASTSEDTEGGDTVEEEWTAIGPPGADVRATDRVRWRGLEYQVEGRPEPWPDERGQPHHIEMQLRRVRG
uniref:hypothetical protein n=1 Tax=Nocardiopsis sp. YSL2 TaxID=2939492 RepID=UPI0026F45B7A